MPLRIIPERSERPENLIQSARAKGRNIIDDDVTRLEDFNRFGVLEPKATTFTSESGAFSSEADVLAGEPSTHEVNRLDRVPIDLLDVAISSDVGPVLGEHALTPEVVFNLPSNFHTCAFKSKIEPSNPSKE